jgi:exo-beta-1,3-glucanase (GH17 family)
MRLPARLAQPGLLLGLLLLTVLAWWLPNRPQAADVAMPGGAGGAARLNSVSFAPFRAGQSPLTGIFPSAAQVDADLAQVALLARGIRSYAAIEGDYDLAALAARHGLRMWAGAWLGGNRAQNARELARLIEQANAHPATIERVVVGNEVLLRRDLPPAELIAALDQVKAAVRQPVTYADVWEFWEQFPEVAQHVDIITIHILPYWEDHPTNIAGAMAHTRQVVQRIRALFPGKPVAIGEAGWPSHGRWRADAAPSRVNQAVFLRQFAALAAEEGLDANFIEAFDQLWKYQNEGTVGAAWGLISADRAAKFPLSGGVRENPDWALYAAAAGLLGLALWGGVLLVTPGGTAVSACPATGRQAALAALVFALGNALAFAWAGTVPTAFDDWLMICAVGNLAGQAMVAVLLLRHVAGRLAGGPPAPPRSGAAAGAMLRGLLRGRWPAREVLLPDLEFLFLWTAMVLQLLLLLDSRYRDFPMASFAVPVVAVLARAALRDLPRGGGGREEWAAGAVLLLAALGSAVQEGPANLQAMGWTVCALLLAVPPVRRVLPART